MDGAVIQMVNHGLTTGALFACVGMIYERYHTREMAEIGGLWNRLPLLAFFLILAALGSAARAGPERVRGRVPDPGGDVRTKPRRRRAGGDRHDPGRLLLALDAPTGHVRPAPGAVGRPRRTRRAAHGHGSPHAVRPVGWHEIAGLAPLMVLIVAIGVYPQPFLEPIGPAVANRPEH